MSLATCDNDGNEPAASTYASAAASACSANVRKSYAFACRALMANKGANSACTMLWVSRASACSSFGNAEVYDS